ncbi:transposase [Cyanobacteria bacterium FACHB-63]|nr:transposase [Cyanobacteria bacterium FACHB-63]
MAQDASQHRPVLSLQAPCSAAFRRSTTVVLGQLLDDENDSDAVWADSAYRSEIIEAVLKLLQFESHIHERAYRNHPLTEQQQADNRERSSIRAKVEHVFGNWTMTMGSKLVRSIGLDAVRAMLGLKHLTYNFKQLVFHHARIAV